MKALHPVTDTMTKTEAAQAVLENWHIVLEENERELHLVTAEQRDMWFQYRDGVNEKIETVIQDGDLDAIYTYLMQLHTAVHGAQRRNLTEEQELARAEEQASVGVLRSLWDKITNRDHGV